MESKMSKLMQKVKLSDECVKALENSKLEKIVANPDKTNYCFYIQIDNTLQVDLYDEYIDYADEMWDL